MEIFLTQAALCCSKLECLRLLVTLKLDPARTRMISGFIDTYLKLSKREEQLLKADIARIEPQQREGIMEIVTSWMEEGMEKGIEKGIGIGAKQGISLATQSLVLRLLAKRIGTLTRELEKRVKRLSVAQLDDLALALLDFSSIADLEAWLEQIEASSSNQTDEQ